MKFNSAKKIPSLFLLLITISIASSMNTSAQTLEDYKWQNRIIFLVDDSLESSAIQQQLALFKPENNAMLERNLILFLTDGITIINDKGNAAAITIEELHRVARITSDFKGVILLGKDGGYKLKQEYPVAPKEIFDLIDSMPMRHFEIKNKS